MKFFCCKSFACQIKMYSVKHVFNHPTHRSFYYTLVCSSIRNIFTPSSMDSKICCIVVLGVYIITKQLEPNHVNNTPGNI